MNGYHPHQSLNNQSPIDYLKANSHSPCMWFEKTGYLQIINLLLKNFFKFVIRITRKSSKEKD